MTNRTNTKVSFTTVEIREYARCLGNNPTMYHDGPSLSIDWTYECKRTISLDEYEHNKARKAQTQLLLHQLACSDKQSFQSLPGCMRWKIIQEHTNCTDDEILANMKESYKTDQQRQLCFENQDLEVFHVMLESGQRKLRRFFGQRRRVQRCQGGKDRKHKQRTQCQVTLRRKHKISPIVQ